MSDESLKKLTKESFGFEVLRVLNPEGIVAAGEVLPLQVVFQPIEVGAILVAMDYRLRLTVPLAALPCIFCFPGQGIQRGVPHYVHAV